MSENTSICVVLFILFAVPVVCMTVVKLWGVVC